MPAQLPHVTHIAAQVASLPPRNDDAADAGRFSAQLEALLGKQSTGAETANPLAAILDTARAGDSELDEDLAALLPFIEALGLTQTLPTQDVPVDSSNLAAPQSQLLDAAVAVLAAPSTPTTAIPAGVPAISAANGQPQTLPQAAPVIADPLQTTGNADANMVPDVREFSAQLVATLAAGKETPQTPGNIAAAQQVIAQGSPAQAQATPPANLASAQTVGTPGWTEEIGNHIAWLASKSESRADLVLTPPQMGRVEISLSIKGDQAAANFVSSNPVVREALEAALPRLREVLADAGIQLGQAQVNAENSRQWAQQEKHGENFTSDRERELSAHAAISQASSGSLSTVAGLKAGRGLVDVFA